MATYVSTATGNFTSTTTWNTVETGTRAIQNAHSASTTTTTSDVYNADAQDFTIANLSVIEGILLFCNQTTSTGTVRVTLSADSGTTATKTLTVNATDLPTSPAWVYFRFATTLTGDGGTDYAIGVQGSSAGNATFYRDATAANWSHIIVTDQNAGSVAAGDVFYIVGEQTGAGTENAFTVTMDSTATTDYGTGVAGTSDNGVDIGALGTLTWGTAATTNYNLKLSGSLAIWGDGTLNMGTTGTPCPRDSSQTLTFDCGANVDFGLTVNNGGTWNAQGLSRTVGKNIVSCKLNTDEAAAQTTLGVDTDTGWLSGDEIAIASTTRTASECESRVLNGNAGASSMDVTVGLTNAHSGTSPTQAEVILLTRNVKIQGASASLQGYVYFNGASPAIDIDWVEFKWLGSATSTKQGFENNSNGAMNVQYSSFHNFEVTSSDLVTSNSSTANGWVFSNNVTYLIAGLHGFVVATTGTWTVDSNIFMRNTDSVNMVTLSDIGGTFTNNTMVGSAAAGLNLSETSKSYGTFSGNTTHSNAGVGINMSGSAQSGTLSSTTIWRNGSSGLSTATGAGDVTFSTITMFGNTTNNITIGASGEFTFISGTFNGDSTFATTNGYAPNGPNALVKFYDCDFGTASGIKTAHTNDVNVNTTTFYLNAVFNNCKLSSSTEVSNQSFLSPQAVIGSQKHDQTAGLHKAWKKYGTITIDTTANMFRTASPSERLTPNNASGKLISGTRQVAVASGVALTPSVYVRESVVGDGTDYNGNFARLIVKRNDAIGITADTVLDTATASSAGAFEQLTGTTATATDDGVMEFYVDCDGTTGWLNVDDWTVS